MILWLLRAKRHIQVPCGNDGYVQHYISKEPSLIEGTFLEQFKVEKCVHRLETTYYYNGMRFAEAFCYDEETYFYAVPPESETLFKKELTRFKKELELFQRSKT